MQRGVSDVHSNTSAVQSQDLLDSDQLSDSNLHSNVDLCAQSNLDLLLSLPEVPAAKHPARGITGFAAKRAAQHSCGKKRPRQPYNRQFRLLPPRLQGMVKSPRYDDWKKRYKCFLHEKLDGTCLEETEMPTKTKQAMIFVSSTIPFTLIPPELKQLLPFIAEEIDASDTFPVPAVSLDMLSIFLGYVHAFTSLDVKAYAVAYSFKDDGTIKYLLLPNIHQGQEGITDGALEDFCVAEADDCDNCIQRCCITLVPLLSHT